MSSGLPYFAERGRFAEKEKLGRGRSWNLERVEWRSLLGRVGLMVQRRRRAVAVLVMILLLFLLWTNKSEYSLISMEVVEKCWLIWWTSCKLLV
jgi:hypothetical protein